MNLLFIDFKKYLPAKIYYMISKHYYSTQFLFLIRFPKKSIGTKIFHYMLLQILPNSCDHIYMAFHDGINIVKNYIKKYDTKNYNLLIEDIKKYLSICNDDNKGNADIIEPLIDENTINLWKINI